MRTYYFLFAAILLILIQACDKKPLLTESPPANVSLQVHRFDKDLRQSDFSRSGEAYQNLYQKYGEFLPVFLESILRIGPGNDSLSLLMCSDFINDPYISETDREIDAVFTETKMAEVKSRLENSFSYYAYYFPDSLIPAVIFYNSGYNFGIYSMDTAIAVGLDWFLGRDKELIQQLPFPEYRKYKMDPQYLEVNVVKDWCNRVMYRDMAGYSLLENLIYYGKIMYLLEALTPGISDSTRMNWKNGAEEWCVEHEFSIWKELASQEVLYDTDPFAVQKWIIDGPFTSGLPQESPAMAGIWTGWQMMRDYHQRFPEYSLRQVLDAGAEEILKSYNPNK